ncbi:MAG: hypothetical protein GX425_11690 [Peptococcaceae bacterium]|nr:hypothetical protein [Peptococcaceae bacterium]
MLKVKDLDEDKKLLLLDLYKLTEERIHESCLGYCAGCPPYHPLPHDATKTAVSSLVKEGYIVLDDQNHYKLSEEGEQYVKEFIKKDNKN